MNLQTAKPLRFILSLASLALVFASQPLSAAKPAKGGGGGGDTTPVPAGTIHFSQSTTEALLYAEMTMKADGSAKTQIGISDQGHSWEPSHQLHGGQRWFLTARDTEVTEDSGWMKQELFALTAAGDLVQLTEDPDLWIHNVRWAKDDSFLSYVAYNWITDAEDLHVADVDWSSGSPVIGLPRKVLSTLYSIDDLELNYLGAYDWSPAGDELVYNDVRDWDRHEIRIARFFADGTIETRHLGRGLYPTWSPDGNWIAYGSLVEGAIWKVRPDGSGAVQLSTIKSGQQHTDQVWSPDSQHLAFTQYTRTTTKIKGVFYTSYTTDILRISANGGTATNVTGDTAADCWSIGWR